MYVNEVNKWGIYTTFLPRVTAPGSPWITMYLAPARNNPVGAKWPGSSKSFIILANSCPLNYHQ